MFEPGSTMKPFFAAYALDNGIATSHEIYRIGDKIKISGSYINENENIKEWKLIIHCYKKLHEGDLNESRHQGKGKQRGALQRFGKMFGSQASTAGDV